MLANLASQVSASGCSMSMRIPGQGIGMTDWMVWPCQWSRRRSAAISLSLSQSAAHP